MTNENDLKMRRIKEKLDFYIDKDIMVHISLNDKRFLNAIIVEKAGENVYVIKERMKGLMHLFVLDIFDIKDYEEPIG